MEREDARFADDGDLARTSRLPGPGDTLSYHDVNQYIRRRKEKTDLNTDTLSRAVHETYMRLMSMGYPGAALEEETDEQQMPTSDTEDEADYQLALKLQREEFEQRHGGRNIGHGDALCHPVLGRWATVEEDLQATSEGGAGAGEDYVGKGKGKAVDKGKGKAVEKGKGKAVY
ncbi:hypothetical protein PAXINDRAFT_8828 [Paxillus involutus ATCC 200175]|nr:hypothetical protein PAXINDRAFT_8828 [Paxillus involutus ATCC 200175]